MSEAAEYIDNEWFVVRHSGEMPEVAYHSAIHFLTCSSEGPGLRLGEEELIILKRAAAARYREIILRDLQPENRDATLYRGVERSIVNYQRYQQFCIRQQLDMENFAAEVAAQLLLFLVNEAMDVAKGVRESVINCSFQELNRFAVEIGLVKDELPDGLASLCPHSG